MNGTSTVAYGNQEYWINLVALLNRTISQCGFCLIWLVGNIGSACTCIVFYQPTFHNSPCAMYFIASSFSQFFTFNFVVLTRMLEFGYNVQAVNTFLWFCKIRYYLFYIFVAIPRYTIIFASIDRYFASSRDAHLRRWSSPKIARRLIIGNTIFWSLIYIQAIVFYKIYNGTCQTQPGAYEMFFSIYILIDSGILPLSLMITFGLLTIKNIHQSRQRIRPGAAAVGGQSVRDSGISRKDAQLHKMLANQVFIFVVLNLSNPCYLLYDAFTLDTSKSPLRNEVELFISNMTYVFIDLGFALTFINFYVSSDMFRRVFKQYIQTKILRQPTPPMTNVRTTARTTHKTNGVDQHE